jgi:hypothetical protein
MAPEHTDKVFEGALDAFITRFQRELFSRWDRCEETTISALAAAEPENKLGILLDWLSHASEETAALVHTYFPKLLRVGNASTLFDQRRAILVRWAVSFVREQVCKFLGIHANCRRDGTSMRA